jgi:hypothetical protein
MNKVLMFPHYLAKHIRASRTDPETLHALISLDEIISTGASFESPEDEEWAWKNGMNIVVSYFHSSNQSLLSISFTFMQNAYATTECGGIILISEGLRKSRQNYLQWFPGCPPVNFISISDDSDLLELVIPPEAPECPDISLRSSDGEF